MAIFKVSLLQGVCSIEIQAVKNIPETLTAIQSGSVSYPIWRKATLATSNRNNSSMKERSNLIGGNRNRLEKTNVAAGRPALATYETISAARRQNRKHKASHVIGWRIRKIVILS